MYTHKQVRQLLRHYHEEYLGQHYISAVDYSKEKYGGKDPSDNPSERLCAKVDLDKAIRMLPKDLYVIINLHYIVGEDVTVVARKLGYTQSTLYKKISDAIAEITNNLNKCLTVSN